LHLATSLELAAACDAPFERARTQLALAAAKLATGNHDAASRLLAEVDTVAIQLDARLLRAQAARIGRESNRSDASGAFAGLTSRELEVLRLVALGRSNAEIANALFISRRTVTTHVERIFFKLDVRSRVEASLMARDSGLI
jgi:DNA-binding NarL/FixJ family response regulator